MRQLDIHGSLAAQRRSACLVFFDESGVSLLPNVRRSWAPRPAAGAGAPVQLEEGVDGGGGAQLAFQIRGGNYDTDSLIEVLGELRRFLGGEEATLLWDGLPAHRSTAMRA